MARVLIVDDEPTDRVILANIIEQAGHECHFASGGLEALETYLRGGIDIVVTDLQMPHGSGLELIEALKSLLPSPSSDFSIAGGDGAREGKKLQAIPAEQESIE